MILKRNLDFNMTTKATDNQSKSHSHSTHLNSTNTRPNHSSAKSKPSAPYIKSFLFVLPILIFGLSSLYYYTKVNNEAVVTTSYEVGSSFPDFELTDIQGNPFKLSQLKNKTVILNFWASWCSPCIEEIPSLIKLVTHFNGDVFLLAISADYSLEDITTFKKSFPGIDQENIVIAWDKDRSLMKKFNIFKLPESFILAPNKTLAKKVSGTINWYSENSLSYFKELSNSKN